MYQKLKLCLHFTKIKPPQWLKGRAFASFAGNRGSIPGRDRPKSLKQVVTAALPNARQEMRLSRVLGDEHYKRMPRVTVGLHAKEPSLLTAMSAEHRSIVAALQR